LALAVTIIEVALIVSDDHGRRCDRRLARDTVFAAVMIECNGIVDRRWQEGCVTGSRAACMSQRRASVLIALTTLTMVFPNVTTSTQGHSSPQLVFAAVVSLVLYGGLCSSRRFGTGIISCQ
jgi:Ca2+/H+ antiporter